MHWGKKRSGFLLTLFLGAALGAFLLSIVLVPVFDRNNIEDVNEETRYLPPKWFEGTSGFLDGTGEAKDVLIDPSTGLPAPKGNPLNYQPFAIKGPIQTHSVLTHSLSDSVKDYGRGGSVTLTPSEGKTKAAMHSVPIHLEGDKSYALSITLDQAASSGIGHSPGWSLVLKADFDGDKLLTDEVPLLSLSRDYSTATLSPDSFYLALSPYLSSPNLSFEAYPEIRLESGTLSESSTLYVQSFSFEEVSGSTSQAIEGASWSDSSRMLGSSNPWVGEEGSSLGIYGSSLCYGEFRYDYYAGAFGYEESGFRRTEFPESEIEDFIARGWMRYSWQRKNSEEITSFAILDPVHCPLRSVTQEVYDPSSSSPSSLVGLKSPYRYQFYRGVIQSCAPQKYAFGTNGNGQDFAKIVCLGFLISLGFGVLVAAVSFLVGSEWAVLSKRYWALFSEPKEQFWGFVFESSLVLVVFLLLTRVSSALPRFLGFAFLLGSGVVAYPQEIKRHHEEKEGLILPSRSLPSLGFRKLFALANRSSAPLALFLIPFSLFIEAFVSSLYPPFAPLEHPQSLGSVFAEASSKVSQAPFLFVSAFLFLSFFLIVSGSFAYRLKGLLLLKRSRSLK
jgi:ABC-type microcin C transport system permease subunit YejE